MARYKDSDRSQIFFTEIDFSRQLVEGTIEHTIDYLLENKIDLTAFDKRFQNEKTGAPAYHPKVILKVILYAYYNSITTSRKIEKACQTNIIFMTLAAGKTPHFTYIADFVHRFEEEIKNVCLEVLLICWEMELIGGEFLALDGCKIPSNAAKEWSGTFADLAKKEEKIRKTVDFLVEKHKKLDQSDPEKKITKSQIDKITAKADKIRDYLETQEPQIGSRGKEIQSNITDNQSAKMKTSKGVIQGYNAMAMVDAKNQVIIHAEAHGGIAESQFTQEFMENAKTAILERELPQELLTESTVIADTGYFSEDNCKYFADENIDAYIPDTEFRKRDPRFVTADRHKDKSKSKFSIESFTYDKENNQYICPNGKILHYLGIHAFGQGKGHKYNAKINDCRNCDLREKCLRKGAKTKRTLYKAIPKYGKNYSQEMMAKIDTPEARDIYSKRMGIVEPVFGNITACKKMDRLNYRGDRKVNCQWRLYAMVHNIEKIMRNMRN